MQVYSCKRDSDNIGVSNEVCEHWFQLPVHVIHYPEADLLTRCFCETVPRRGGSVDVHKVHGSQWSCHRILRVEIGAYMDLPVDPRCWCPWLGIGSCLLISYTALQHPAQAKDLVWCVLFSFDISFFSTLVATLLFWFMIIFMLQIICLSLLVFCNCY